ncbi:cell wall hydrolase [Sphingomonas lacunae]|uniref:Cell wall hydrolase n=1 Tax=Sphingomonas lacunae TaxID=2698828 RepID=A0A6M4AVD0_9SPHN|nr:cell wall hydrolase [Sphingomonas lacunae]QJQ33063.1 cell wall hydrolase [Sphingomonas lacunae]
MVARRRRQGRAVSVILILLLVIGLVIGLVAGSGSSASRFGHAPPPGAPPPIVAPVALMDLAAQDARAANALQPFVSGGFPAATPFRFTGDTLNAARAVDCLAAAVLYEAGDDADGQRAVAQVVINRARHPAFPKSICGVVFQGSERTTGCQFTFTCDGALNRRWSEAAWERARGIAIDMLNGATFPQVGLATHYHTDWVRPYWSPSLDKLAQVGTHLFFRWPGGWGAPRAYDGQINGQEPVIGKLASLSAVHAAGATAAGLIVPSQEDGPRTSVNSVVSTILPRRNVQLGDTIILTLDRSQPAASFPVLAQAACGTRSYCKVMGWTDPALVPSGEVMNDTTRAAMSFSYLRDEARGLERALWNCQQFAREAPGQCMRR